MGSTTSANGQCAVFSKLSNGSVRSLVEHCGGHCVPTDLGSIKWVVTFIHDTMYLRQNLCQYEGRDRIPL